MLTDTVRTLDINITRHQMEQWKSGIHIQNAMPNISAADREFIMTGITQEEWDAEIKDLIQEEWGAEIKDLMEE